MSYQTTTQRAASAKLELDLLSGCAGCGRRLVGKTGFLPGITIISSQENPHAQRVPVCGECAHNERVLEEICNQKP